MNKTRILALLLALACSLMFLTGCNSNDVTTQDPSDKPNAENKPQTDPDKENEKTPKATSALTGLPCSEEEADLRPVAFAVNNEIEYLPSDGLSVVGLSEADVIFETNMEANGSGTRLLPLFSQKALQNTERVGSIRSARPYFIQLALMADAYYCHDGESSNDDCYGPDGTKLPDSEYARWMLNHSGIDRIALSQGNLGSIDSNLMNKIGTSSKYNTLCAYGPKVLEELLSLYPEKTYDDTARRTLFCFGENKMSNSLDGKSVKVIFSLWNNNYTACDFVYDEESGLYEKGQYVYRSMETRTVPKDVNNQKTLTFKNVFVLFTNQYAYDYDVVYNRPYHTKIDLLGFEGDGYYFTDGKYIPIRWVCDSDTDSPIRYYTLDGEELIVNRGKSYVNLVCNNVQDKIEIK